LPVKLVGIVIVTGGLSGFSCRFVERPALRQKQRPAVKPQPVPGARLQVPP
jgi:peptidoglycan/LPS O-acetylase OafA/YrhL